MKNKPSPKTPKQYEQEIEELRRKVAQLESKVTEQEQVSELLRSSEERLELALEGAGLGFWDEDYTSGQVIRDERWANMLGYRPDEIDSNIRRDLVHPDDIEGVTKAARAHKAGLTPFFRKEQRMKSKSGEWVWILNWGKVIERDKDGNPLRAIGTHQDITKRKQAEEERQAYIRFLEHLDEIDRVNREYVDPDQLLVEVARVALSIFNCDRAYMLLPCEPNAPTFRVIVEETQPDCPSAYELNIDIPMKPGANEHCQALLDSDGPVTFGPECDQQLFCKEAAKQLGVQSQMSVAVYPKIGKPWILSLHQCSRERVWTTEEKRLFGEIARRITDGLSSALTQRELQESEKRFKQLSNATWEAVVIHDDGVILEANEQYCKMFGYKPEEVIGHESISRTSTLESTEYIRRQVDLGNLGPYRANGKRKDGTEFPMELRVRLMDYHGKQVRVAAIRDETDQEKAKQVLRESHQKHERLVKNLIGAFLYRHDTDGVFDYVSPSITQVLGYKPEELSKRFSEYLTDHPKNQEVRKHTELSIQGIQQPPYEAELLAKDGKLHWVEVSEVPVCDANGQVVAVEGIAHDITVRKQAEEALRDSEMSYRELYNNSMDCIFIHDYETGAIVDVNSTTSRVLGYSIEEIKRSNIGELSTNQYPYTHEESVRWVMKVKTEGPQKFEWLAKDRNGRSIWFEIYLLCARIAGKKRILAFCHDITERKHSGEERERLMLAIEQAAEVIVITDVEATIQYVNPAFERVTGYTREEAIGKNPRILQSGEHDKAFYMDMWDMLKRGASWTGRLINKKKDGSLFTEEAMISPVRDASGNTVNYVCVKRDVTHEIKLETQLRQSQKMEAVGQLAGGVAHDFNNLLQAINGYAELALSSLDADHVAHDHVGEIAKAGERAARLVHQLLAFSRQQVLEMKDINLNDLIVDLMKIIRRVIGEHITLELPGSPEIGIVRADPGQVEQILMNLCVNARDAMPDGGRITIETENVVINEAFCELHPWAEPGHYVLLIVTDTGCGMDKAALANIFEPFFTTKEVGKGTGLGLSTVYGLVKQHRGMVNVYSEVGKGTTFRIYLPVVERSTTEVDMKIEDSAKGGTEIILLAEDDEVVRRLSRDILEGAGYTVLTAADGEEALQVFEANVDKIDLALLDVVMPKLGGRAVYEKIKMQHPETRILFSSGYSMNAIHTNFVLEEGFQLLRKPYQRNDILLKVRETLDS
jgi:PAS domain S-box-containing protein